MGKHLNPEVKKNVIRAKRVGLYVRQIATIFEVDTFKPRFNTPDEKRFNFTIYS